MKEYDHIAKELERMVKIEAENLSNKESKYESLFEELEWRIEELVQQSKAYHEESKSLGLNANSIDAEGHLRCALAVEDILNTVREL